jgi:hypothetical protein
MKGSSAWLNCWNSFENSGDDLSRDGRCFGMGEVSGIHICSVHRRSQIIQWPIPETKKGIPTPGTWIVLHLTVMAVHNGICCESRRGINRTVKTCLTPSWIVEMYLVKSGAA